MAEGMLTVGLYRKFLFPRLMNCGMASPSLAQYRIATLNRVTGRVLEIGFGTGLNLEYYPEHVREIIALDPNPGMRALAEKRIASSGVNVNLTVADAQSIPFGDEAFDSVVSTWTLCSIPDVDKALREVYRVLTPGGRFFFLEHGLSGEAAVRKWQHWLTPIQRRLADGCHLNRNMRELVETLPWQVETMEEFYAEQTPRTLGYLYRGVMVK